MQYVCDYCGKRHERIEDCKACEEECKHRRMNIDKTIKTFVECMNDLMKEGYYVYINEKLILTGNLQYAVIDERTRHTSKTVKIESKGEWS